MNEAASPNQELNKQNLLNPREISKGSDQSGRKEILAQAQENKSQKQEVNKQVSQKSNSLEKTKEKKTSLNQQEQEKKDQLEKRINNIFVKLKKLAGLKDSKSDTLSGEIGELSEGGKELEAEIMQIRDELNRLKEKFGKMPSSKELMDAYYEKAAETPLSNEEKRQYLKPELLSQLSMDEYIALWKRLNPHFLSHVTRQGFRDHSAMETHRVGVNEFSSGFTKILSDEKKQRTIMDVMVLKNKNKENVSKWLREMTFNKIFAGDEASAKKLLDGLLNAKIGEAPAYPDRTALHLAAQRVSNSHYGAENNNEVFFIYPSDMIASQNNFAFNGWEKDFTKIQSDRSWNDLFVWSDDEKNSGLQIDSGIVFLPKNTEVDAKTGSKYASKSEMIDGQEKKVMIEDQELANKFMNWASGINNNEKIQEVYDKYKNTSDVFSRDIIRRNLSSVISGELIKLGFNQESALNLTDKVYGRLHLRDFDNQKILQEMLDETGAHHKRAENPIKAQDYWENYFKENPQLKPKHIVYYDGDPTTAVYDFQQKHGIGNADTSEKDGKLLSFDDHHVTDMKNDPRANRGYDELKQMAEEIIEEYYAQQRVPA